ncbi:MAG: hypothetical protein ACO33Y_03185 [Burkholderiaceae bacterium]
MLAMKIQPAPRTVAARIGMAWLTEGFRLFHRQPLIWFLTLFAYWAGLVILAMVPLLGLVAPLILTPGLGFGFVALAYAVDRQEMPSSRGVFGVARLRNGFLVSGGRAQSLYRI